MKKIYSACASVLFCAAVIPVAHAQSPSNLEDSNSIFNWAERNYFQFFPNHESIFPSNAKTLINVPGWAYRHYPATNNYVGVFNHEVYIAGASFSTGGLTPIKIFPVVDAMSKVNASASHANKINQLGAELPVNTMHSNITGLDIKLGGYGSAMTAHPQNVNQFYALTDRGPTSKFKGDEGKGRLFAAPEFSPRIGLFELNSAGSVVWIKDIIFKDPQGHPITGLPNSNALGGTGEVPYDAKGNALKDASGGIKVDDFGLDSEGLVALKDGTFWVSDEYGPHIVHFDATGREIGRINPFVHDSRAMFHLPAELANREKNHGMEGLAITPDQKMLVGIMQSTLSNPDKDVIDSKLTRIVTVNLETGIIGQYIYKQRKRHRSNCEIVALSSTQFLVIERDGKLLYGGSEDDASPDTQKLVYQIDLSTGTNLEAIPTSGKFVQDAQYGLTIKGETLEQYVQSKSWDDLADKGIVPVDKVEIVDMVSAVNYPHGKMEGLWVIDAHTIGILNDDNYSASYKEGGWETHYINEEETRVDKATLYVIKGLNLNSK